MIFKSKIVQEPIFLTELAVRDYKELLKCILGDEPDKFCFVETICTLFSNITNKPSSFFKTLSVLDFLLLIIDVRIYSNGHLCPIRVQRNGKTANLDLNLSVLQSDLIKTFEPFCNNILQHEKLAVVFDCPSVEKLVDINSEHEEYLLFLKKATIFNQKALEVKTMEQTALLFDKLSPKMSLQIIEKYKKYVEVCASTNFLSRYRITESTLNFVPTLDNLIWFAKLLFNESLEVFYNNLFYLAHYGHMNLTHIEQGSVGEYIYYANKLRSMQNTESNSTEQFEQNVDDDGGLQHEPV